MKKIIMICNHFAPDNMIAAVRTTKLAGAFKEHGYEVIVIAEKKKDIIEDEILKENAEGITVIRVSNSEIINNVINTYKKIIAPIKEKKFENVDNRMKINPKTGKEEFYPFETAYPFIGSMDYLMELLRQYDLAIHARKYLKELKNVDYMFSSYGDFFSLFASKWYHKRHKKKKWIFDMRDAICNYKFTPQYVRWIAGMHERYIWREADAITAVSKGICSRVPEKFKDKAYCVTNGYDKRDREGILLGEKSKEKMRFVYTGAMYGGIRNLSPLFENIRSLIDEEKISYNKIEFCFAGKDSAYDIFKSQAQKYRLDEICIYYGKLTRKEALQLQMEADVLLVSSFDYQTDTGGVITGKALEYMSANKPIIAIINGDIEHSELAEIIRNGNLGLAYEESHAETDREALKQYLAVKYQEFEKNGVLEHKPNEAVLKQFDYQYLGKEMMRIIEELH